MISLALDVFFWSLAGKEEIFHCNYQTTSALNSIMLIKKEKTIKRYYSQAKEPVNIDRAVNCITLHQPQGYKNV